MRVLPDNPPVDPPDPPANPPCSPTPPTPSPKCPLGSSNGSISHTIAHHHRHHHTQIGQESKAATKIQASFRGMRERRQRKKEESAALKIQAVHSGRKVNIYFWLFLVIFGNPRTGNQYDVVFFI